MKATNLTKHGVKLLCESTDVLKDFKDSAMILQVVEANVFSEEEKKKNIKARI